MSHYLGDLAYESFTGPLSLHLLGRTIVALKVYDEGSFGLALDDGGILFVGLIYAGADPNVPKLMMGLLGEASIADFYSTDEGRLYR